MCIAVLLSGSWSLKPNTIRSRDSSGSFAGHSDPPAISDGTTDLANSDYGIEDECFFAFEVNLMVIEDSKLSVVEQLRNRSRRADTWSFLSSNRESYLLKHLLLDFQSASIVCRVVVLSASLTTYVGGEFVPELSAVSGLGTGRDSASRLDSMLRHMSKYMAQLAQDGCNVIYSIPIWTNRVTVPSSALTDCRHQVATKDEITRENCGIDREARDCPVVLILGSRVFRPLPQITVPWIDGWPMRNKDQTTLRTIYVSRDTFLKPLLPILKMINRRTTLTPKNVTMIDGKWTMDVGTFEDTFRYNKQACDWRQDKFNHDTDGLHFVWSHSEDVARGYRPDIDSIQSSESEPAEEPQDQKAEFSCMSSSFWLNRIFLKTIHLSRLYEEYTRDTNVFPPRLSRYFFDGRIRAKAEYTWSELVFLKVCPLRLGDTLITADY